MTDPPRLDGMEHSQFERRSAETAHTFPVPCRASLACPRPGREGNGHLRRSCSRARCELRRPILPRPFDPLADTSPSRLLPSHRGADPDGLGDRSVGGEGIEVHHVHDRPPWKSVPSGCEHPRASRPGGAPTHGGSSAVPRACASGIRRRGRQSDSSGWRDIVRRGVAVGLARMIPTLSARGFREGGSGSLDAGASRHQGILHEGRVSSGASLLTADVSNDVHRDPAATARGATSGCRTRRYRCATAR